MKISIAKIDTHKQWIMNSFPHWTLCFLGSCRLTIQSGVVLWVRPLPDREWTDCWELYLEQWNSFPARFYIHLLFLYLCSEVHCAITQMFFLYFVGVCMCLCAHTHSVHTTGDTWCTLMANWELLFRQRFCGHRFPQRDWCRSLRLWRLIRIEEDGLN